jgi:hypothetical protein
MSSVDMRMRAEIGNNNRNLPCTILQGESRFQNGNKLIIY